MTAEREPRPALLAGVVLALDVVADHVVLLGPDGRIVHANVAWQRFALDNGDEDTDWIGVDYVAASSRPAQRLGRPDPISDGVRDVLEGRRHSFEHEYDCHAPDEMRWFRLVVTETPLPGIAAIVTHTDITVQRLAERALEHYATHDRLTGLANRAALEQHLGQMVAEGQQVQAMVVSLPAPDGPLSKADESDLLLAGATVRELFPAPAVVGRWGPRTLLVAQSGASDEALAEFERVLETTLRELLGSALASATAVRVRTTADVAGLGDVDGATLSG